MNNNLIGGQITKFRKASGLTQEELGRAVGVSTQAVSRWECGGAPDVALLPAIADTLHVTIDALFGREGGTPEDMGKLAARWLAADDNRTAMERLVAVPWMACRYFSRGRFGLPEMGCPDTCKIPGIGEEDSILRSQVVLDAGLITGMYSKELSFISVFPEPEEGYQAYFSSNDRYRQLFSTLALPGCLELLLDLYAEKPRLIVPEAEAKRLGVPAEDAEELMEQLSAVHVLEKVELELATGHGGAYKIRHDGVLVPILYFSRFFMQKNESYYLSWVEREKPLLRKPGETEKKHEKK